MMQSTARIANHNAGAVLLAGIALVLCVLVAFVSVLQNAVQRGETFRQQLSLANGSTMTAAANAGRDVGSRDASSREASSYGTRFLSRQHALGAPLAPAVMFAVQGSR